MTGLTIAAAVTMTGCGSGGAGGDRVDDPADDSAGRPGSHGEMPVEAVAAVGEVITRGGVTVMDTGTPELCLGPVAESYPPQCSGPPLVGWSWAASEGHYDQQDDIRWGVFVVSGTWDGTTFLVASADPGDGSVPIAPELPLAPKDPPPPDELERIADEVRELGGATGAYASQTQVLVDVPYDDGSLQDWVDAEYGAGVVAVVSSLIDA